VNDKTLHAIPRPTLKSMDPAVVKHRLPSFCYPTADCSPLGVISTTTNLLPQPYIYTQEHIIITEEIWLYFLKRNEFFLRFTVESDTEDFDEDCYHVSFRGMNGPVRVLLNSNLENMALDAFSRLVNILGNGLFTPLKERHTLLNLFALVVETHSESTKCPSDVLVVAEYALRWKDNYPL